MCAVIFALICSISATVFVGSLAWDSDNKALLETYKLCLSFTLIGTAGTVVKAIVDTTMEEEREKKRRIAEHDKENERRYEAWENTRIKILREFIEIFSTFYSLRKLYHSAYSKSNSIYSKETDEYKSLIRECLKKATDLEGRFGVLKVLIIGHFDLPGGEFEHRPIEKIISDRDKAKDNDERLRLSLDILGEAYDDWRHALEQNRKIDCPTSWEAYREILAFIDSQRWKPEINGNKAT